MEMTRQRLRPAMQDILSNVCPHCKGAGHIVSVESGALRIIRRIFEEIASHKPASLTAKAEMNIANFILNQKRSMLARCEETFDVNIIIEGSSALAPTEYNIETVAREISDDDKDTTEETAQNSETEKNTQTIENKDDERERASRKKSKRRRRGNSDTDIAVDATEEQEVSSSDNKKERRDKRRERDDKRKSKNQRRGRGRNAQFSPEAETFTTTSGTIVLIENPVSVQDKNVTEVTPENTQEQEKDIEPSQDIKSFVEDVGTEDNLSITEESVVMTEVEELPTKDKDASIDDSPNMNGREPVLEDAMVGTADAVESLGSAKTSTPWLVA